MQFKDIVSKAKKIRASYNNEQLYQYLINNGFEVSNYNDAFEDWLDEGDRFYKGIPNNLSEDEVKQIFEKSDAMYNINYESNYENEVFITINFTPIYTYNSANGLLEITDYEIFECSMSDYDWDIEINSTNKTIMTNFMNGCDDLKKLFARYINLLNDLEKYGIKCWR